MLIKIFVFEFDIYINSVFFLASKPEKMNCFSNYNFKFLFFFSQKHNHIQKDTTLPSKENVIIQKNSSSCQYFNFFIILAIIF